MPIDPEIWIWDDLGASMSFPIAQTEPPHPPASEATPYAVQPESDATMRA